MSDRNSEIYAARLAIKKLLTDYPELIGMMPDLINGAVAGRLKEERDLRAKTEIALAWALARKQKGSDEDLAKALEAIQKNSFCNFSSSIERLRK